MTINVDEIVPEEIVPQDLEKNLTIIQKFMKDLPDKAMELGIRVVLAGVCLFVGIELIKLIRKILKKSLTRAKVDLGVIQFIDSFTKAALYIILAVMIASDFGLDAASIIALLGSAGVAIGLALQGSLANLAGGVLLMILKPFRVGDYIVEDAKGNEGTVTEINMFYTKLTTIDGRIVVLPNGILANNSITNVSAAKCRMLDFAVGISYQADMQRAKQTMLQVMQRDEAVIKEMQIISFVKELGSSEVVIGGRCYVENKDYFTATWRMTEEIKRSFDANDIEIPFTQVDVHMKEQ